MPKRLFTVLLWLLALVAIWSLALLVVESATRQSNGFTAYYTSARLLRAGEDVSRFYDDDWFRAQISAEGVTAADIYQPHPPTTTLLLWPVAWLGYDSSRVIWITFILICFTLAVGWLLRELGLRGLWLPGALAVIAMFQPVRENVYQGQAYLLLLGLFTLVWYGYRERREGLLGLALAALLLLKLAGPLFCLLLLLQRRWRALAWTAGSSLIVVIGLLPWIGTDAWRSWIDAVTRVGSHHDLSVTAYQSQASLTRHIPTIAAPWNLASWLEWLVILTVTAVTLYTSVVSQQHDLVFAAIATISVIVNPLSLDYHYALLLLPIAILAAWSREQVSPSPLVILLLAVALIGLDLPYRSPRFAEDGWLLFAYPKLYGAWLLAGLALWGALRHPEQTSAALSTGWSGA